MADIDRHPRYPRHELLGSRVFDRNETEPSWQNMLDIREVSWLAEHVLLNQIVFPAAGYIGMAGESMRQLSNGILESYTVRDFSITSALLLRPDEKLNLRTRLRPVEMVGETRQWHEIQITSYDGSHWVERCVGKVSAGSGPSSNDPDILHPSETLQRHVARAYWYDVLESNGLKYGPAFQGLDEISTALTEHKAVATIATFEGTTKYLLHPVTIDQCLQIVMLAACNGQGRLLTALSTITAIQHLVVFSGGQTKLKIGGTAATGRSGSLTGDVSVVSEDDRSILLIKHCETSLVPNDSPKSEEKIFSFVKWDTDATYCDLNQALALSHTQPDPSMLLDVLKLLAHKNPRLRILELGNGADETTRVVLDTLKSQYGDRLYLTYTYAATSFDAAFRAKMAFKGIRDINVVFFDIEQQLQSHILQAGAYDLIITTDFISSARNNITAYVDCLKYLIHPLGHLLLLDTLPGSSASKDKSFIGQVHTVLLKSGFGFGPGNDGSSEGFKVVAELRKPLKHPKKITIVVPDDHHPLVNAVQTSFQDNGIGCDICTFESKIPQGQDMMLIVDFGGPYLYNITEARFRDFANRLSSFKGSMIWVTPTAQISCNNPNSSMTLGMTRTLRAELRKDITVVEIDVEAATLLSSSKSLVKIYQSLSYRTKAKLVDPDYEYAIVDGDIKIPRIHWTTGKKELSECAGHLTRAESGLQSLRSPNETPPTPLRFRSDACYLLVGGLGGLGRVISTWMVESGARNILFLSRSAKEGPEITPFFDELRARGCEVLTFAGSVTNLSDVEAAIAQATRPVAGVMQMSAVMRDNWMSHMTFAEWDQCVRPKVQGTWNLHQATSSTSLDFFLLFSSICGMSGQWGQANYNSANAFLDAFVNYRHGHDLPASVVDIGFMGCVGMAVENRALVEKLTAGGYLFLGEQDLIDALTIAIAYSRPGTDRLMNKSQLGLGLRSTKRITDPSTRVVWKKDARMVLSHQFESLGIITDEQAREYLNAAYQGRKNED
ncbi:hypothetical protein MMC27_004173 [Xylographa pallens]|nr:hypothetical protein [Xylographa pallens]